MSTLLRRGTVIELEPATVEVVDLRVDGGRIVARGSELTPLEGEEVIDVTGKLVAPGLVCAHHHFYLSLARGMPGPERAPETYLETLEATSWRLDAALDHDLVELSGKVGALEALSAGTTTVFDLHASPSCIEGSLIRLARGVNEVGLRAVLGYEATDRHGAVGREAGIEESVHFQRKARGRFRGMVGAHASFTLSDDALHGLRAAVQSTGTGVHLHLAEDPSDDRLSLERFGMSPVGRLLEAELLGPSSVVAHAVHVSWPELSSVIATGAWLVHNPRSNMNTQVGYAPAQKFGMRATLGTDGLGGDMWQEAQLAYFRSKDAGAPLDPLKFLANGHRMASLAFGIPVGPMREGAAADLVVLDYRSPTPLNAQNLPQHLVAAFGARHVESVMVDGMWRMWARRPLSVQPDALALQAREGAASLWARMAELERAQSESVRRT